MRTWFFSQFLSRLTAHLCSDFKSEFTFSCVIVTLCWLFSKDIFIGCFLLQKVLIVEDENGNVVKELMKDTDAITLYKSMKECLIYLTHLDPNDIQHIMVSKLSSQLNDNHFSWSSLNKICWAVGSVSGAMSVEFEKSFLVVIIKGEF